MLVNKIIKLILFLFKDGKFNDFGDCLEGGAATGVDYFPAMFSSLSTILACSGYQAGLSKVRYSNK